MAVAVLARLFGGPTRARASARLWDCGAGPLSARMEYTATSFAEPLQRVFDDVVRPEQRRRRHPPRGVALPGATRSSYRLRVPDRVEHRLYAPGAAPRCAAWGRAGRRLANGSVHRYLGYGFVACVARLILLVVTAMSSPAVVRADCCRCASLVALGHRCWSG